MRLDFLKRTLRQPLRRIVVGSIGGVVMIAGVGLLFLPGPAIVVIPLGLAILATEFPWARKWMQKARALLRRKHKPA